jgi:hypothetical protein
MSSVEQPIYLEMVLCTMTPKTILVHQLVLTLELVATQSQRKRHGTKRASVQRRAKRKKNKLEAFDAKSEFLRLGNFLCDVDSRRDAYDAVAAAKLVEKLEKIIKRVDTSSSAQFLTVLLVDMGAD